MKDWTPSKKKQNDMSASTYNKYIHTPSPYKTKNEFEPNIYQYLPEEYSESFKNRNFPPLWVEDIHWWYNVTNSFMSYLIYNKYNDIGGVLSEYSFDLTEEGVVKVEILQDEYDDDELFQEDEIELTDAVNYWKNLMYDKSCKIVFIKTVVKLEQSDGTLHSTWTIIDKVRKVVEFFDPNGAFPYLEEKRDRYEFMVDWVSEFKKIFCCQRKVNDLCFIPKKYNIMSYESSCSKYGFQYIEYNYGGEIDLNIEPGGYCVIWCLFMLDLRLGNIGMDTQKIQEKIIRNYLDEKGKFMFGLELRNFIRNYMMYVHSFKRF